MLRASTGNGVAKEPIGMAHGHEQKGGLSVEGRGGQRGINWDNCNSTINFKKRKEEKHISLKTEKKK